MRVFEKTCCAGLALLVGAGLLAAQAALAQAPELPVRLRFERLTNRDGLSQNTIFAIEQDRQGFLWFGTKVGLNRYDGYAFKTYSHDPFDQDTLSEAFVRVVLEDRSGDLWIGTYGGGLNRFDLETETFDQFRHRADDETSLSDDDVRSIYEDIQGVLWVGTGRGLNRFEAATGTFTRYVRDFDDPSSLSHNDVRAIVEDQRGTLWIGTNGRGLNRLRGSPEAGGPVTFEHFMHDPDDPGSLVDNRVRALLVDRYGHLWIGTSGGLDRYDPVTQEFHHYRHQESDPGSLASDQVRSLFEDQHGRLWVGTVGGLHRLNVASGTFEVFRSDPFDETSLSDDDIRAIFEDRAGGLWIGTYNGGLNRFDPDAPRFRHYRHDPENPGSLGGDDVRAVYEDRDGRLWVGTYGGGLNLLDRSPSGVPGADEDDGSQGDPGTTRFVRFRHDRGNPNSLSDDRVICILQDSAGALWLGMYRTGLSRFDPVRERFTHFQLDPDDPSSLSQNFVRSLLEDRSGRLWVGTHSGLNLFDPVSETFRRFRHDPADPSSLSHDSIFALHEDASGDLWIGTYGGGLNRLDPESGAVTHFRHDPEDPSSLSHDNISSIHGGGSGPLWLGTYGGGLEHFDPRTGTFRHHVNPIVLVDNVIFGILEDRRGFLWLSTNRGLVRFDPAGESWTSYDARYGLQNVGFNPGAFHRSPSGEMFFGGNGGLNSFHPETFEDNTFVPPVVLTSFRLFDEEVVGDRASSYLQEIVLDYRQNFFSFEYAALNFQHPDKNRYKYRLEGLDDDWVEADDRRYASYTQVPPGAYTFRVQGSNNDGVWNNAGVAVRITIRPPWFQTGWFYTLAGFLAVALVVGAFFGQRRRLRHQAAEELRALDLRRKQDELAAAEQWARDLEEELQRRKQLEEELERIISQLEAKTGELERFTYTVSHDLKSPLFTIQGFLGMLESDLESGKSDDVGKDLQRIQGAAEQMAQWLDELLKLSRVGRVVNPPQDVSLYELAREAVELTAGRIQERGVEVTIDPELPVVSVDRQRMLEVLQNLIENAAKFMGSEAEPRVEIAMREDGGQQVFFVRDNGIGIDPIHHEKVFGLFNRLDSRSDGSGIGLVLVKRIIEVHGGRIWIESQGDGRGTTVCFTLGKPVDDAGSVGAGNFRRLPA